MRISIFNLREMSNDYLLSQVKKTLSRYPLLKEIYDKEFVMNLVKKRFFHDNYLLWLLVNQENYATLTWDNIVKNLELLRDCDGVSRFREKLRSREENVFENYLTELEFAGHYKERGFHVELEPSILKTERHPDFLVKQKGLLTFFEVGNLFAEEILERDSVENHIRGAFHKIEYPYVIILKPDYDRFKIRNIKALKNFVLNKLRRLSDHEETRFPLQFHFPNEEESSVEVVVWGKAKKSKRGYLGGIGPTAFRIRDGDLIRRKISKKISQLPKDHAGVLVIEFGPLSYDETDIEDALFGTLRLRVHLKTDTGEIVARESVRSGDKIFSDQKNTRLSALIYSKRKYDGNQFVRTKKVYHNPFAFKPISKDFFSEHGAKQLIPQKDDDELRMEWV